MPSKTRSLVALLVFVVVSFSAAAFGAAFSPGDWFAGLQKPSWNPPSWIFGPVWTVLYLMIATAAWRIWTRGGRDAAPALAIWGVQLVLNALWSWLFFGLHNPALAFAEIVLLWLAIVATVIAFWRRDVWSGALLVPYLAWVTFASVLNFTLWQLNP